MDKIERTSFKTRNGHSLDIFFNVTTGLLVVDLNHKERSGGNELVRLTLDERRMLAHCRNLPKWDDVEAHDEEVWRLVESVQEGNLRLEDIPHPMRQAVEHALSDEEASA